MAIKANASSQGADFKKFVGVGSFRVLGVNPTKEELSKFYGRDVQKEPEYLKDKVDEKDGGKPYKQLRVTFMIQADPLFEDGKPNKTNAKLKEPFKTTVSFYIDSRYRYGKEKSKVEVMDKYGRTAWVTVEQAKNHQIPVYKNGPARLDADYHPMVRGEEALTQFILNYLNVTPIETYNKNTGEWIVNSHPEDCEGNLYRIKDYFKGDISELKEYCQMMPTNRVKLCVGVQTDDQGNQYNTVYSGMSMRNGAKSYTAIKDTIDGDEYGSKNTVFSNDPLGIISDIDVYNDDVKETDLSKAPAASDDPFAKAAAIPEAGSDLPFGEPSDEDPFKDAA